MKINRNENIAIISDIHSNHISFETMYEIMRKKDVDKIVFLGDYLSDCPYPMKTVDIIMRIRSEYETYFIRGNREDYLIDYHDNKPDWSSPTGRGSLRYTYENMDKSIIDFYKEMPLKIELDDFIFCHASPKSNTELMHVGNKNVDDWLKRARKNIICGHTHVKADYKIYGKRMINPGSVGISFDNAKKGSFGIIKIRDDYFEFEFIEYDYDYLKLYAEFKNSGLFDISGYWAKAVYENIMTGKPMTSYMLKDAFSQARQAGIEGDIIPEFFWGKAAEKYGIGDLND
ncbi:MAG: metallophosphoesterase family protein [Tissierellia bacterium]|nr:metallophosphoesterase family protein [Tissierellia bacterium]